jgi:hypothetical protein
MVIKFARHLTRPRLSLFDVLATFVFVALMLNFRWWDALWSLLGSSILNVALKRIAAWKGGDE